eukprot:jgi/Mesen1/851/ME000112S11001
MVLHGRTRMSNNGGIDAEEDELDYEEEDLDLGLADASLGPNASADQARGFSGVRLYNGGDDADLLEDEDDVDLYEDVNPAVPTPSQQPSSKSAPSQPLHQVKQEAKPPQPHDGQGREYGGDAGAANTSAGEREADHDTGGAKALVQAQQREVKAEPLMAAAGRASQAGQAAAAAGGSNHQRHPVATAKQVEHGGGGGAGAGGGEGTVLLIGDLQWWTQDAELEAACSHYGPISQLKFFEEKASGKSKGYCQVDFADAAAARACKEQMHGRVFNGRACVVTFASQQTIKQLAGQGAPQLPGAMKSAPNGGLKKPDGMLGQQQQHQPGGRGGGPMKQMMMGFGMGPPPPPPPGATFPRGPGGGGYGPGGAGMGPDMGPPFPNMGAGLPGVAPHINPAFFGRGGGGAGLGPGPGGAMDGPPPPGWEGPGPGGPMWEREEMERRMRGMGDFYDGEGPPPPDRMRGKREMGFGDWGPEEEEWARGGGGQGDEFGKRRRLKSG